jgi:drug/metabolite transporter (DMT)-like permease
MNNPIAVPVDKRQSIIAALLIFTGAVLFSSKAVMVKLAYRHEVDSISLLTLRMLFSLPFYLVIAYRSERKGRIQGAKLDRSQWLEVILYGVLGYYLASLFDFIGLQYIPASLERLILFVYPTLVLILSALFLGKKITRTQALAVLITYIGIALAFVENLRLEHGGDYIFGSSLIFFGALAYAIYLIGSGRLLPYMGSWRYTSLAMIASSTAILIHHGLFYHWRLFHFAAPVYYLAILMAIFATVLPSFLISEGIRIIGAGNAAIVGSVGPISTIILAYIFLEERLSALQWMGAFVVIGGVLMITLRKR